MVPLGEEIFPGKSLLFDGIALVQTVGKVPDKMLFPGAECKCPGVDQGYGHGRAVFYRAADTVQSLGILFWDADTDGDVIALPHCIENRATIAHIEQIGMALEPQHLQRVIPVDVCVRDEGVPGQILEKNVF